MATIHKFTGNDANYDWEHVDSEPYNDGATRRILIGPKDGARNFVLRYFKIPPNLKSALDRHEHDHGVYILRGKGRLFINGAEHILLPGDTVHIAPNEEHQLQADGPEPLGFLCIIPPI